MTRNIQIRLATTEHIAEISALAAVIWRAHYPGIISPAQIEHMLAKMYGLEVIQRELESGLAWFRALDDGVLCGFASVGVASTAAEFKLHKLYVHPDWQRRGIGGALLEAVESSVRAQGATTLILNVNKRNDAAIATYLKRGFTNRESVVADIGGGFVMDDHVMAKSLS